MGGRRCPASLYVIDLHLSPEERPSSHDYGSGLSVIFLRCQGNGGSRGPLFFGTWVTSNRWGAEELSPLRQMAILTNGSRTWPGVLCNSGGIYIQYPPAGTESRLARWARECHRPDRRGVVWQTYVFPLAGQSPTQSASEFPLYLVSCNAD